jgi:nucleotidyltransferase substrate binding protein (TIGR01987 family)
LEQAGLYRAKVEKFKKALLSFNSAMGQDLSLFEPVVNDILINGQVQKFEYCSELMWKTIRTLIRINNEISAKSPKDAVKEFYNCGYIEENDLEIMVNILEDRNKLSHVYNEEIFLQVHGRLSSYREVMNKVLKILEKVSIS